MTAPVILQLAPEIGQFSLMLALALALLMGVFPLTGTFTLTPAWIRMGPMLAFGQFTFLSIAMGCLIVAFLANDFSVSYVAQHSNTQLPLLYRVSAVWGGHEGSLLLWAFLLGGWTAAVAALSRHLPDTLLARVLSVQGLVSVGFLLFMILTSNPFARIFPFPSEGRDLNPLLQDPGLAIHPPMLYMGYVGFSVAYSFSMAALMGGRLDASWARWSRPWTIMAWIFLTLGITLGSWWAYYELGWGGWWFWDPVENASLMPWLVGTALIHSLAVSEKRGAFKSWTVLLALFSFSLSLMGTFLVRSGVLTSVHAFASDPTRGTFILVFLSLVVGTSLTLYAWRAPEIPPGGRFDLLSRETALLINNLLLTLFAALILFGTLVPLIYEALDWGKISVGFPWFNRMFLWLMPWLVFFVGLGPLLRWKRNPVGDFVRKVWLALLISLILGLGVVYYPPGEEGQPWQVGLTIGLVVWLLLTHARGLGERYRHKSPQDRSLWADLTGQGRGYYGMLMAHLGVGFLMVGITLVSHYGIERDIRMMPGDSYEMAGYRFRFEGVSTISGPNYQAHRGAFQVFQNNQPIARLEPEKRVYLAQGMPMTEAAIDPGFTRDLYLSLGEPLQDGAWGLRIHYKPFVRWIWLGGLLMVVGGLLVTSDRRYRRGRLDVAPETAPTPSLS
ncbi:holocytochrome c synthase CcmF component [Gammaproteobacteria bacterium]